MQNNNLAPGGSTTVTAAPEDASGNPGGMQPTNVPTWSTPLPATGLSLVASADGFSAVVTAAATAPPGVTTITVQGTNSGGGGFNSAFTITIAEQPAREFGFTFS
jgi:hypothetical protein